ncbi:MAG TPA: DUF454 family protein [Thermoanaerobaculia bacterium]|jgi:uncharacterized membrane protein YbaN (DUF454 family)
MSRHTPPLRRGKIRNLILAIVFFILGVIGVLIPVMPQIAFFIMSAIFLSLVFPSVRRAIRRFRHRHPRLEKIYREWRHRRIRKRQERIRKGKDL